MSEDMYKEFTITLEETIDFGKKHGVVFHVFKHFDGTYSVIVFYHIECTLVITDITGDDVDILYIQITTLCSVENIFSLRMAV